MGRQADKQDSDMFAEVLSGIITQPSEARILKRQRRKISFPFRQFGIAICVIALVVSLSFLAKELLIKEPSDPDQEVASSVLDSVTEFEPYLLRPDKIPEGLEVDTPNIKFEEGILTIPVKTSGGNVISITQQAVPEEFVGTQPIGKERVETDYGVGGYSNMKGTNTINVISNDGVFILISSLQQIDVDSLKAIAYSLSH